MIPRVGVDLEPGLQIARSLPELDLLDVAYGAVHGGARMIMVPVSAFVASTAYSPDLFNRPGLPLFVLKCEMEDLDRVPGLGAAPDRVVVTAERHRAVPDAAHAAEVVTRTASSTQETGVLIEPEAALLKELSRLRVSWAYFSTLNVFEAAGHEAAEAELARLTSATLAANKLGLRVALLGPTGRHLPPALAALPHVEEIYPTPDLWAWALRSGWEKATAEYIRLLG